MSVDNMSVDISMVDNWGDLGSEQEADRYITKKYIRSRLKLIAPGDEKRKAELVYVVNLCVTKRIFTIEDAQELKRLIEEI